MGSDGHANHYDRWSRVQRPMVRTVLHISSGKVIFLGLLVMGSAVISFPSLGGGLPNFTLSV